MEIRGVDQMGIIWTISYICLSLDQYVRDTKYNQYRKINLYIYFPIVIISRISNTIRQLTFTFVEHDPINCFHVESRKV